MSLLSAFADELEKLGAAPRSFPTPQSSNVQGFRYDAKTQQLYVTYKSGGTYRYNGVPPNVFKSMRRNKSVGKTIHKRVKGGGYAYEKLGGVAIDVETKEPSAKYPVVTHTFKGETEAEARGYMDSHKKTDKFFRECFKGKMGDVECENSKVVVRKIAAAAGKKVKNYKCKFCKDPATKGVIWAEGRAIVPCCDKHLAKGKAAIDDPSDIDTIRDLTKTSEEATSPSTGSGTSGYGDLLETAGGQSFIDRRATDNPSLTKKPGLMRDRIREGVNQHINKVSNVAGTPNSHGAMLDRGSNSFVDRESTAKERFVRSRSPNKKSSTYKYYVKKRREMRKSAGPRLDLFKAVWKAGGPKERRSLIKFVVDHHLRRAKSFATKGKVPLVAAAGSGFAIGRISKVSSLQSRDPGFSGGGGAGGEMAQGGGGGSVIPDYAGMSFVDRKATGKKLGTIIKDAAGGTGGGFNGWSPANNTTDPISESFVDPLASAKIQMREKRRKIAKMAGAAIKTLTWGGLTMKFEYLTGQTRSGTNKATGKSWSRKMRDNYGYIPGTYGKGADGEAIDVYFSDEALDGPVFKIRQKKKTGEYDEDKFMVGYGSAMTAKGAFLRNMPEWAFGSMMSMSMRGFRKMVGQGQRTVRVPSDGNAERDRVRKALKGKAA